MFQEFINKYLGRAVDVDGAFGCQCVDLFNAWNRDYNNCYINCSPSGYAHSIAENKVNNGILNYYNETAINNMIEGTVVVYGECDFAPYSHVCFFIKDNGDGTYQALNQNDKGRMYVTIDNNPYDGIIGAFIPKQIQEEFNRKLEEQRKAEEESKKEEQPQEPENTPIEEPIVEEFKVGDVVVPIELIDYDGTHLVQYDENYTIIQINGDRTVLEARGQVWAAMNTNNIKKV